MFITTVVPDCTSLPVFREFLAVTKLTCSKINLINQNRENIKKNDLVAVNMNNTRTIQININLCKTTHARQLNNRSNHWITIVRIKRNI
jgi:hypothetical protein